MMTKLCERLVVPVASEQDAETTCSILLTNLHGGAGELHVVHVIEKADGALDKAPLAARQEQADEIFEYVSQQFDGTEYEVHTDLRYGTSVLDEIYAAADEGDATAIAFTPRPGNRITRLLSGNLSRKLIDEAEVPLLVFPEAVTADEDDEG